MRTVEISTIDADTSIQCRSAIDMDVVADYAEKMKDGEAFPPVVLFGTEKRCWIGDGWHRINAARSAGITHIECDLKPGSRVDALRFALGANAAHGIRRTNADKRRCVEIALKEFGDMSNRAIAAMCGVSDVTIMRARGEALQSSTCTKSVQRTGADGKAYPVMQNREDKEKQTKREIQEIGPPQDGMQFARIAIMNLREIQKDDSERKQAFETVRRWIDENE